MPRVLAIHCVHIDDADIQRLAENKVQVAVCPRSNAKLGCGIAPIVKMVEKMGNLNKEERKAAIKRLIRASLTD